MKKTPRYRHLLVAALLVGLSGCGGPLVKVTGRVMYKGQPVPSTMVIFEPDEPGKRASRGITDDDGNFQLSYSRDDMGALKGHHTVVLSYHMTAQEEIHEIPPKASKEMKAVIAKYGDPKTSPLHYEITKSQFIELDLQ